MQPNIHFSLEEKIKFLQDKGLEVKEAIVTMAYPCYHDDMEYEDLKVWAIYKDGQEYQKPGGYNFQKEEWLDNVFRGEVNKKLKQIIIN